MKHALVRVATALVIITLGAMACRQGEPIEPRTPPNSPLPKVDRPDDKPSGPVAPKLLPDGGASK